MLLLHPHQRQFQVSDWCGGCSCIMGSVTLVLPICGFPRFLGAVVDDFAEGGEDEAVEGVEVGGSGDLDAELGPGGGVHPVEAWGEEGGGGFGVEVEADPFGFGFEDEAHGPPARFVEVDGEIPGGVLVGELEGDFLAGGGVEDGGGGEDGVFELLLDDGEGF